MQCSECRVTARQAHDVSLNCPHIGAGLHASTFKERMLQTSKFVSNITQQLLLHTTTISQIFFFVVFSHTAQSDYCHTVQKRSASKSGTTFHCAIAIHHRLTESAILGATTQRFFFTAPFLAATNSRARRHAAPSNDVAAKHSGGRGRASSNRCEACHRRRVGHGVYSVSLEPADGARTPSPLLRLPN